MKFSFNDKLSSRLLVNLLYSVWAIPCVLIIRLLRPIILIRIGTLFSGRIGHFAKDAGIQWIENKTNGNDINIYWLDKDTCNKQWEKMVRRNFFVHAWVEYVHVWNKYIYGGEKHYRPSSITGSRDIKGLLESNNFGMLKFLEDEEKEAKEWLINKGWNDGEPFVCIQVRDTAYLGSEEFHLNYDWDYHDYRNSNISTYILAIKWLLEQGVFVLRMGKKVNKKTPFNHPKFVDYPFCSDKSDLLDIWLFANCNLCISTGSGPDAISDIYRRPVVFLNYLPLVDMFSWSFSINHPKNLVWKDTGKALTLDDYLNYAFYFTEEYINSNIEIIDLTQEEILDVVIECWSYIQGDRVDSKNDIDMQKIFWNKIVSNKNSKDYHGYIHKKSRISTVFLDKNLHE